MNLDRFLNQIENHQEKCKSENNYLVVAYVGDDEMNEEHPNPEVAVCCIKMHGHLMTEIKFEHWASEAAFDNGLDEVTEDLVTVINREKFEEYLKQAYKIKVC